MDTAVMSPIMQSFHHPKEGEEGGQGPLLRKEIETSSSSATKSDDGKNKKEEERETTGSSGVLPSAKEEESSAEKEGCKEQLKEEEEVEEEGKEEQKQDMDARKEEEKMELHPSQMPEGMIPIPRSNPDRYLPPRKEHEKEEKKEEVEEEEEEARGEIRRTSIDESSPKISEMTSPGIRMSAALSAFSQVKEGKNRNLVISPSFLTTMTAGIPAASPLYPNNNENNSSSSSAAALTLSSLYNNNSNNNNNDPLMSNGLTGHLAMQHPSLPPSSPSATASLLQATLAGMSSPPNIHNKDIWLEISMHAHIVSNLAAMAQGQRLSAPPLDMIRSHLNHINGKVRELAILYPHLNNSTSSTPPYPHPALGQIPPGWRPEEEFRPELRPLPKISNTGSFSEVSIPSAHHHHRGGTSSAPQTPNPTTSPTSLPSTPNGSPVRRENSASPPRTRDDTEEAASILTSSRLLALAPTPPRTSTPQHQFHHYTVSPSGHPTATLPASRFQVGPSVRTLKFSSHRVSQADSGAPPHSQSAQHQHLAALSKAAIAISRADSPPPPTVNLRTSGGAAASNKNGSKKRKRPQPSCDQCHTMYTPEWRRGPRGAGTLCNACGLRYSRQEKRQKKREEHMQTKKRASIDAILNP